MKLGKKLVETVKEENTIGNTDDTWLLLYIIQNRSQNNKNNSNYKVVINNKNILESKDYKYVFINISTSNILVLDNTDLIDKKYPVTATPGLRIDKQSEKVVIHTNLDFDVFSERFIDARFNNDKGYIHIEKAHNLEDVDERLNGLGYNTKVFNSGCKLIKYSLEDNTENTYETPTIQSNISNQTIDIIELHYFNCVQAFKKLNSIDTSYRFIDSNGNRCKVDNVIYFSKNKPTLLLRIPDLEYITDIVIRGKEKSKARRISSTVKIGGTIEVKNLDTSKLTNGNKLFSNTQCNTITTHKLNLRKLNKIRKMFVNCTIDTLDISNIDLSKFKDNEIHYLFMESIVRSLRINIGKYQNDTQELVRRLSLIFEGIKEKPEILYINTQDYKNQELKQFGKRIEHSDNWVYISNIGGSYNGL